MNSRERDREDRPVRIAITCMGETVSPRFDCAPEIALVDVQDGGVIRMETVSLDTMAPGERVAEIRRLDVDTLVCGALDRHSAGQLSLHSVSVYSWVTGLVEDVLSCLLQGDLESGMILGLRGRCCGRWGYGGRSPLGERTKVSGMPDIDMERNDTMPNRDGSGPAGKGPGTGRGIGPCGQGKRQGGGPGRGQGRGRGQGQGQGRRRGGQGRNR